MGGRENSNLIKFPSRSKRSMTSIIESSKAGEIVSQQWSCNLDHFELMLQFHCKLVSCSVASINNQILFVLRGSVDYLPGTRQHRVHYARFFLLAEQETLLATLIQFASSTARLSRGKKVVEGVMQGCWKHNFSKNVGDSSVKCLARVKKM